jgi:hypothetical protein
LVRVASCLHRPCATAASPAAVAAAPPARTRLRAPVPHSCSSSMMLPNPWPQPCRSSARARAGPAPAPAHAASLAPVHAARATASGTSTSARPCSTVHALPASARLTHAISREPQPPCITGAQRLRWCLSSRARAPPPARRRCSAPGPTRTTSPVPATPACTSSPGLLEPLAPLALAHARARRRQPPARRHLPRAAAPPARALRLRTWSCPACSCGHRPSAW